MQAETLASVRKNLPATVYAAPLWKGLYFCGRDLCLFALASTLILQTDQAYLLIPLWALQVLSMLGLFQLGHDIAHGALFRNKKLSWWLGQLCFLPVLHPYSQWVYGHNRIHHGNTSKLKADLAWHPRTADRYQRMSALDKLLHRIYWSAGGGGIYYLVKMWLQGLILFPAPGWKARRDILIVILFAICSSAVTIYIGGNQAGAYSLSSGLWIFAKLQLIPFVLCNYAIGIIVYIHHINPNIRWKKGDDWTPFYGQMKATTVYRLPSWVNFFAHNIMIHVPHHVDTRIPFYNLPAALQAIEKEYGECPVKSRSFWRDYYRTTRTCKLIDTETSEWLNYAQLAERTGTQSVTTSASHR